MELWGSWPAPPARLLVPLRGAESLSKILWFIDAAQSAVLPRIGVDTIGFETVERYYILHFLFEEVETLADKEASHGVLEMGVVGNVNAAIEPVGGMGEEVQD